MGTKLKKLSSKEVVAVFAAFGFTLHSQKGSHLKLRRLGPSGKETLTIPERKEIAKGTLREIFKQASVYIPQSELQPHFYNQ